jgi:hypothetical protein
LSFILLIATWKTNDSTRNDFQVTLVLFSVLVHLNSAVGTWVYIAPSYWTMVDIEL